MSNCRSAGNVGIMPSSAPGRAGSRSSMRRFSIRVWMMAGLLLLSGGPRAQAAVTVSSASGAIPLADHLAFARDPGGEAGIADRHALEWFKADVPAGGSPAFGYTSDAIWARVDIENEGEHDVQTVVELTHARLKQVTWHVLAGDRVVETISEGLHRPAGRRLRYPLISVDVPAGATRTMYLRVQSRTSVKVPLILATVPDYLRHAALRDFLDYAFVGVCAAFFLLALLNACLHRNRLFLLLTVITGGFLGYYLIFHGYYAWLGGPAQGWVNRNLMLSLAMIGNWAFFVFTLEYARSGAADCRHAFPCAGWLSWILLAGGLLLCMLPFRAAVNLMFGMLCVCHAAGAYVAFHLAGRSPQWSHWLMAGVWAVVLLVVLLMFAGFFVWRPLPMGLIHLQRSMLAFIFLVFFVMVMVQQRSVRQEAERARRAEHLATETRLRALRYQLNPHFLFNTLTSIEALSRAGPGRIAPLVRNLSVYLRLRLQPAADGMVVFQQEWESMCAYLDIEQVRFSRRLRVHHDVADDALNARVPEMLMQPLVENAVKYGMKEDGLVEVFVRAWREGDALHVRVENIGDLHPEKASAEGGIGLRNVKERLRLLYGGRASFSLRGEGGRVVAEIVLPLKETDG